MKLDSLDNICKYLEYDQYASLAVKPLRRLWHERDALIDELRGQVKSEKRKKSKDKSADSGNESAPKHGESNKK